VLFLWSGVVEEDDDDDDDDDDELLLQSWKEGACMNQEDYEQFIFELSSSSKQSFDTPK